MIKKIEATLTHDEHYTEPIELHGMFNITLSGTWVGTVSLQRSFDNIVWHTVDTATANESDTKHEPESGVLYRVGITTYTSGSVTARLSQ